MACTTAGYTTSSPDTPPAKKRSTPDFSASGTASTIRPQQTHRIPQRYNDFIIPSFCQDTKLWKGSIVTSTADNSSIVIRTVANKRI